MSLPASPSAGHLVALDLETVALDLASVPLDDILEFREHHGQAYRRYVRNIRRHVSELGQMEPEERETAQADRREELTDLAKDLRNTARLRWRGPLGTFALGAAGAAWLGAGPLHDPLGAVLAFATVGAALAGTASGQQPLTAYSYVFQAKHELSGRTGR